MSVCSSVCSLKHSCTMPERLNVVSSLSQSHHSRFLRTKYDGAICWGRSSHNRICHGKWSRATMINTITRHYHGKVFTRSNSTHPGPRTGVPTSPFSIRDFMSLPTIVSRAASAKCGTVTSHRHSKNFSGPPRQPKDRSIFGVQNRIFFNIFHSHEKPLYMVSQN